MCASWTAYAKPTFALAPLRSRVLAIDRTARYLPRMRLSPWWIIAVASAAIPLAASAQAADDGAALERRLGVQFTVFPSPWKRATQVMDTIWQPLGLRGVNHYAYAGPVPPHAFAARSDPASQYYQAWFGVYIVAGDSALHLARGSNEPIASVRKLAEYDQRSWLEAMGDPHPIARSDTTVQTQSINIDGVQRTLYLFHMQTHSDLNDGSTPLGQFIGMPRKMSRQQLPSFHDVSLHVYYAFWYDTLRKATVIVYASSSAYVPMRGSGRHDQNYEDNGVWLDKMFHSMISGVHILNGSSSAAKQSQRPHPS